MLGRKSAYAQECFAQDFIGTYYEIDEDLTHRLPNQWRAFNKEFIPSWLESHPGKSKIAAGLACGSVWTVSKGIETGDVVLCPDGTGHYRVGEVTGEYFYKPGGVLP